MKCTVFSLVSCTLLAAALQAGPPHVLRASFPDGTGLDIFSQSTSASQIELGGEMGIGPGVGSQDLVNRVVVDRSNAILFVYNVEAARGSRPDTVMIRIEPISAASEAGMLKNYGAAPGRPRFTGTHLPTVAGVREFPAVKFGEAVTLDILSNPSTGEKIFDVLRPVRITGPPSGMSVTPAPDRETISLDKIALRVNGRAMSAPASFIIGSAVRLDIPGLGSYVVAAYDPGDASPTRGFRAIAQADGKSLSWAIGSNRVEITSGANILTRSAKGALWVYHDPHYRPDVVGLQSAETVDWLLPRK